VTWSTTLIFYDVMANNTLVLFCLVQGDSAPFEVTVTADKSISFLKDLVLEKGFGVSRGVLAKDLTLWKVRPFNG
jgi:hypothetical protein